ncbi:hypothetical protein HMI54_013515 [Coelomomyces lativittatus]|nr:hypothetical protein HMI56_005546 [Coelomomyces lativittatus]KAJ1497577.1 hypothetical protein HMI54_013515 [Coelomomyces lativittatus]KAJ1501610.1 hypothetical protein HMI55_003307 [Coelomomyces lativittatus]
MTCSTHEEMVLVQSQYLQSIKSKKSKPSPSLSSTLSTHSSNSKKVNPWQHHVSDFDDSPSVQAFLHTSEAKKKKEVHAHSILPNVNTLLSSSFHEVSEEEEEEEEEDDPWLHPNPNHSIDQEESESESESDSESESTLNS